MHRRSYYPHNQQISSQITATSSTNFISSRPETPNFPEQEYSEGANGIHAVGIRDLSMDGHDPMDPRNGIRRTGDYDEVPDNSVPLHDLVNEKHHIP